MHASIHTKVLAPGFAKIINAIYILLTIGIFLRYYAKTLLISNTSLAPMSISRSHRPAGRKLNLLYLQ